MIGRSKDAIVGTRHGHRTADRRKGQCPTDGDHAAGDPRKVEQRFVAGTLRDRRRSTEDAHANDQTDHQHDHIEHVQLYTS